MELQLLLQMFLLHKTVTMMLFTIDIRLAIPRNSETLNSIFMSSSQVAVESKIAIHLVNITQAFRLTAQRARYCAIEPCKKINNHMKYFLIFACLTKLRGKPEIERKRMPSRVSFHNLTSI